MAEKCPEVIDCLDFAPIGLDMPYRTIVQNNPVNFVDPLGLWQISFSGGVGLGGQITFGYNTGQWNFGAFFGAGEGASITVDPHDSGCEKRGFNGGLRGEGQIGLGPNVDATANIGFESSSAELSLHVPGTPLNFGVSEENANIHDVETTFSFGESGFIGLGGTAHFGGK